MNLFAFLFLLFLERDRSFAIPAWFAHVYLHALARECHIAQTRKRLKNARETALFGARVPARRGVARVVSRTYTLARSPYTFSRASLVRARSHAREAATFRAVPRCVSARGCLGVATTSREAPVSTATSSW